MKRLVLLLVLAACSSAQALVIDGFSSLLHNRFADDASFIAAGYDLSGVGRSSDGRWGTLVSRNVFLSANHFRPAASATLRFYATNDPNGAFVTRTVTGGQRIGASDIWAGVLDSPVPTGYATYAYATEDVASQADFAGTPYGLQVGVLVGRSPDALANEIDVAVGRNVLDGWVNSVDVAGSIDSGFFAVDNQSGDGNYVAHETLVQGGDSGAPLFTASGSTLTIVGTGWYVGTDAVDLDPDSQVEDLRDISGYTYLGNYDSAIQGVISAYPIPEPGVVGLVLGLCALALARARHRYASLLSPPD